MHCSVIIPHLNQTDHLRKCINALTEQESDGINFEIIVVDNGSEGNIEEVVNSNSIKVLYVKDIQNPYACRNHGIQYSQGEVVAFLDAKCVPTKNWLKHGFRKSVDFDIVAGRYNVESDMKLSSKVFPLMYLNSRKNVQKKHGVTAGNLFVKRHVFDVLGKFKTTSTSGNDILFTKRAIYEGLTIGSAERAVVNYPKKEFGSLISDIGKYGKGSALTGQKSFLNVFSYLMPMRFTTMRSAIKYRKFEFSLVEKVKIWFYIWRAKIQFAFGIIQGLLLNSPKEQGQSTL
tara:strand:+ start:41 stop:904 length:864 start_codon:yes stop_codon:yes gene_type:complete